MRSNSIFRLLTCSLLLAGLLAPLVPRISVADEPEEGYTLIFNGTNLNGWETKKGESLEEMTEAYKGRFKVSEGILVIDPQVKGDVIIQTTEKFGGDLSLKFEFQPGAGCNNDLFFRGVKFDIKKGGVNNLKENEWNEFEIIVKGDQAEFLTNGVLQRTAAAKDASPFGFRAEFGSIQLRKLRVRQTN